jgi:serine kinase of HPr protein (carbohydrate metabolism regulator)
MTAQPDPAENPALVHASCVAIQGRAVLLMGESGSGKSDLALRLIDRGAHLVSDDYTECERRGQQLYASPPGTIAGKMEVRYIGVVPMPYAHDVPVALAISLNDKPQRMPDQTMTIDIAGIPLPVFLLDAFEPSAPIKAELALRSLTEAGS